MFSGLLDCFHIAGVAGSRPACIKDLAKTKSFSVLVASFCIVGFGGLLMMSRLKCQIEYKQM